MKKESSANCIKIIKILFDFHYHYYYFGENKSGIASVWPLIKYCRVLVPYLLYLKFH